MNHREGRFGRQEAAAAVGLGALISGCFTVHVGDTYRAGNVCYAATAAGVLLGLLLLSLIQGVMARTGERSLGDLIQGAIGPALAPLAAVPLTLGLALSASLPLSRLALAMERYVFVEADYVPITLYLLPVLLILVWRGMECVARMAKLLALPALLALGLTVYLAAPAFRVQHLFPLLSPGFPAFLQQTFQSLLRFLPGGVALCVAGRGCQGGRFLQDGTRRGLLWGGAGATALQLCLGLTFYAEDMAALGAPIYCMTMAVRQERMALRLDMLVLFLWLMGALVVAAFYVYAAALLFVRLTEVEDIRPAGALLCLLAVAFLLLGCLDGNGIESAMMLLYRWGALLFLAPLGLCALFGLIRGRRA